MTTNHMLIEMKQLVNELRSQGIQVALCKKPR